MSIVNLSRIESCKKKKSTTIVTILLFSLANLIYGQSVELDWVNTIDGNYTNGTSLIINDSGYIYSTGYMIGTMNFHPSSGINRLCCNGAFLKKSDSDGNIIWVKGGNLGWAGGSSMALDNSGNIYSTGVFEDTIDFDPGTGVFNLSSTTGTNNNDIFIQKLDPNGNLVWAKKIGGTGGDRGLAIAVDNADNVYITGIYWSSVDFNPNAGTFYLNAGLGNFATFILKLDPNGNFIWAKTLDVDSSNDLAIDGANNIYMIGSFDGTVDFDPGIGNFPLTSSGPISTYDDIYIEKLDSAGNFIWAKMMGNSFVDEDGYSITADRGYLYSTGIFRNTTDFNPNAGVSNLQSNGDNDIFIQKLDTAGNFIWAKSEGGNSNADKGSSISVDEMGNLYIGGIFRATVDFDPNAGVELLTAESNGNAFIQKLDTAGNFIWANSIAAGGAPSLNSLAINKNGDIFTTGSFWTKSDFDPTLGTFNSSPTGSANFYLHKLTQHKVLGRIFHDFNQNCVEDISESNVIGRHVIINPGNIIATTNSNGYWGINSLPSGTYNVTIDTSGQWSSTCHSTYSFTVVNSDSVTLVSPMGLFSTTPCSAPNVSIHAPFLRPGFSNQRVYVQACNQYIGTGILDSAYVLVELDSLLTPQTASIPFSNLGNNIYRVNLDSIFPGECISFWLDCHLSIHANLGTSLCLNAILYPIDSCTLDSIPNPLPPGIAPCYSPYDNSHLTIHANCNNDTITFEIENTGDGDMSCFSQIRLFIDGQHSQTDSIQLMSNDTAIFSFLGDGRTWRLEVDQHPLHPGNSQPSATIELCGNTSNWTPNLVNILPHDDADPHIDIFCGLVTGSYDPNDKTGYPLGVGITNDILPNQNLEYLIRFQNTGTDTAFNVVIRDTLTTDLDILTIQSGVSSHNYSFKMYGPRILEWTFSNIMLPDSNINEPASHGFVKFEVKPKANLPNSTVIQNSAAIYFDFNPPIITNTSWHTIHEDIFTISIDKIVEEQLQVKIYPNPTTGLIYIDKNDNLEINIQLVDNLGQVLIDKTSNSSITEINLDRFTTGIYYLSINNGKQTVPHKIIKQ